MLANWCGFIIGLYISTLVSISWTDSPCFDLTGEHPSVTRNMQAVFITCLVSSVQIVQADA